MWEENRKIIDIVDEKNLLTWTKDREGKTEIGGERRSLFEERLVRRKDLDDKGLGQNKVLCSSSGVKLLIVNYHAGFPALPAPGRQISGYLPASGSRTTLTRIPPYYLFLVASSLLPHLARVLARPVGRPRFRFRGSVGLTVGIIDEKTFQP